MRSVDACNVTQETELKLLNPILNRNTNPITDPNPNLTLSLNPNPNSVIRKKSKSKNNNNSNNNDNQNCIVQVCQMTSETLAGQLQSCYTARARPKCLTEEKCF